jgi:hypothetical protein
MRKLILVLLLGCAACTTQAQDPGRKAATPAAPKAAAGAPATGDTLARIRSLVGDAACTDSTQCRSLPIGAIACGGPQGYLPYAPARVDERALLALSERYKAERQAENKASGLMSTCRYMTDPGAVCTAGTCQLGSGSAPSTAR